MYKKYFDAHFHWFDHSAFSDRLSSNIGDLDTKEYFLETYGRYGMTGGIMMGNGGIEKQGDSLPDGFYYCVGLDQIACTDDIREALPAIEKHLQREKCVGVKLYPGYVPLYPHDECYVEVLELLLNYNKTLAVHTGMLAALSGKLKYAHPIHLDDIAVDYPELRIVMCHFGNPFLAEAAAVMEHNRNVYADLSGLLEGLFVTEHFVKTEELYISNLKTWIRYIGEPERFLFGTDWPAVKCDEYVKFIASLFDEKEIEQVLRYNAYQAYNIKYDTRTCVNDQ